MSEDATRITARVEYDKETDRMVGFILPFNEDGLPLPDSYLATSFEAIEYCFNSCQVSSMLPVCGSVCFPNYSSILPSMYGKVLCFETMEIHLPTMSKKRYHHYQFWS